MIRSNWLYIAVMFAVSYTIRILPLTLIRKPIKNQFIQSFLYYVPYVTLAVMTFPAIVNATQSPVAGAAALVAISFALSFACTYLPGISALSDGTRTIILTVAISCAGALLFPVKTQSEEAEQ